MTPFLCVLVLGASSWAGDKPIIQSIEGDKVVIVKTPQGNRVGAPGTEINFGDRVRTGPQASAKILYPDGSKMLVGRGTELEILESREGAQWNQLNYGEVRGIIKKLKLPQPAGKPRFVVRSKTAVMGVRGTDFVYTASDALKKSEVHTLDGVVEVAKDEKTLMSGQGVPVVKDQYVSADDKVIQTPQKFDRAQYISTLETAQPDFVALVKNDPDAISREENRSWETVVKSGPVQLFAFQMNGIYSKQEQGGEVLSAELSWNPTIRLWGPLSIRGLLGVFPLKGKTAEDRFYGFELGGLVSFSLLNPLIVEAGLSAQGWSNKRASPDVSEMIGVAFKLSEDRFLERIFVGANRYHFRYHPGGQDYTNYVTQLKAGVGFQF